MSRLVRTVRRAKEPLFGVLAFSCAVVLLLVALSMWGCAVGYPTLPNGLPDYSNPVIGPSLSTINTGTASGVDLLTKAMMGAGIGAPVVGVLGLAFNRWLKAANLQGREQGYVDYENDTTVRVVPPPAPVMVASAPAFAPMGSVGAAGVQPVSGTNAAGNSVPSVPVVELTASKPRKAKR